MIEKLIQYCANRPVLTTLFVLLLSFWGWYALKNTPLDAIPDLSDSQVIVYTEWDGRSPDIIEDQITYPIVSAMVSAPKVVSARGYSMFGASFVYLLFDEGTDQYWARSRVLEYLSKIRNRLPTGVNPSLGPDATGVGWVLTYALVDQSGKNSLEELRSFQDWKLRYLLEAVPGVAEVASVGGYALEYQIQVNPLALAHYGITTDDIMTKVKNSNRDVGGRVIEMSERQYFVRTQGYLKSLADIENITLKTGNKGEPILIKHVATVSKVPGIREGAVDLNGKGEAVSGIVVMRSGEDVLTVVRAVKATLTHIKDSLPEGTQIQITYDRSKVIETSIDTLKEKLLEEMFVVALVIILFLWHMRSALVPIITLPIAVLFAFIPMHYFGVTSNIMSLAGIAIAIGDMVDAAIVMVENAHKALEKDDAKDPRRRKEILIKACQEVGRPIFFSLIVMAVAFMPIMALTGQEGKLFKPLAFTKNFSILFAAVLAITLGPVLIVNFLKPQKDIKLKNSLLSKIINFFWVGKIHAEEKHPISQLLFKIYHPALDFVLKYRKKAVIISVILILSTIPVYKNLGTEFMPPLNEGDLLYMPITLPGISIEKSKEWLQQQDKLIYTFGEVESVFGKVGRAETATDPAPLSMVETVIQLKPHDQWPKIFQARWYSSWAPKPLKATLNWIWPEYQTRTWQKLIEDLNQTVQLPGTTNAWVFPIKTRIDMLTTGIRTPVGIKIFGDDLSKIQNIATNVESLVQNLPNTRSVIADRSVGGYYVDVKIKREQLARYGLTVEDANMLIEAVIGGMPVTTIIDGRARYPVNIRYQPSFRDSTESLERALVSVNEKQHIPLSEIADVSVSLGPSEIKDENGFLTSWVFIDLATDSDITEYVEKLDQTLKASGFFTEGFTYKISGQYEFIERANARLKMVIPFTLFLIIFFLYLNTHSWIRVMIVLLAIPFSLVGAFWLLYFLGYKLSIAVWVGLIALAGLDAETGVVMLLYLDLATEERKKQGLLNTTSDLIKAIHEGAVKRVRPKIMTVLVNFVGLLPIMIAAAHETGADVAKRIAAPMVGGITTSLLMELLIYPCIYLWWQKKKLKSPD